MTYEDPTAGQVERDTVISADTDKEDSEQPELQEASRREGLELAAHLIETSVRGVPLENTDALVAANALAMIEVAKAAQRAVAALEALSAAQKENEA